MKLPRVRLLGRRVLLGVSLSLVGWLIYFGVSIWAYGKRDAVKQADCAIILGAAVYGGTPSPVFEERIRHAVDLYHRGLVSHLVFTGGYGAGATHAESVVGAEYAIASGVPNGAIFTETKSHTTLQNLVEAKAQMKDHALTTAIIVSDPLHLKRASMMARDIGISASASATPTSRYRSLLARLKFLFRELYFVHHYLLIGA